MSSIGTGNLASVSLAAALASGQRTDHPTVLADAARQGADFAQRAATLGASHNVGESHGTSDRDADGRMSWQGEGEQPHASSDEESPPKEGQRRSPADPRGRAGKRLDLNV